MGGWEHLQHIKVFSMCQIPRTLQDPLMFEQVDHEHMRYTSVYCDLRTMSTCRMGTDMSVEVCS